MKPRMKMARAAAARLVKQLGLTPPVDLNAVCTHLGLEIRYTDLGSDAPGGVLWPDQRIVWVHSGRHIHHQRLSVAHELGHDVLNHREEKQMASTDEIEAIDSAHEHEAYAFARELLMPWEELKRDYFTMRSIPALVEKYRVSDEVVWIRLQETGCLRARSR